MSRRATESAQRTAPSEAAADARSPPRPAEPCLGRDHPPTVVGEQTARHADGRGRQVRLRGERGNAPSKRGGEPARCRCRRGQVHGEAGRGGAGRVRACMVKGNDDQCCPHFPRWQPISPNAPPSTCPTGSEPAHGSSAGSSVIVLIATQAGLAAALSWVIARDFLHNPMPVFAPSATAGTIAPAIGQRARRTAETLLGSGSVSSSATPRFMSSATVRGRSDWSSP